MRPQSCDCGVCNRRIRILNAARASMRPQSCDCGVDQAAAETRLMCVASMRPQSCDCGVVGPSATGDEDLFRFNEAAVVRLRSVTYQILIAGVKAASMRPQSCDCGVSTAVMRGVRFRRASMRPQSCDCGVLPVIRKAVVAVEGFNEAAVVRLRSVVSRIATCCDQHASMRPQSCDCGVGGRLRARLAGTGRLQ